LDTMKYITPNVYTLVLGEAMGNAAMLVASGRKGNRFMLPHARMMTCPPRMNRSFGSTVNMMIRAEDLEYNTQVRYPRSPHSGLPSTQHHVESTGVNVSLRIIPLVFSGIH
jgi:ATP-dependent protease ClpP protease subunit